MNDLDLILTYIDKVLSLPGSVKALENDKPILLTDHSDSKEWRRWCHQAVKHYQKTWQVTETGSNSFEFRKG